MDPYTNPDQQSDATLQAMVTRLEERAQHPAFLRLITAYASELPTHESLRLLELGCGTGVVIRELEKSLHPESSLHGADISERLLAAARSLAPDSRIHWDKIEPGVLPYPTASFDCVLMHTLLSHVPDVAALLSETARILKPGGRLIVCDADHAGTTFAYPDFATMRDIDFRLVSAIATHPDICRQMPRYLKDAGFELRRHESQILSEAGRGDFWLSSVRGYARLIPALNILPEAEGKAWVEHQLRAHEEGSFFAAGAFYTFHAVNPRSESGAEHPAT